VPPRPPWRWRRGRDRDDASIDVILDDGFVAIDLETTGLDVVHARVVEVAAIPFRRGRTQAGYRQLVNPGVPIPAEATRVHGIADADVRGAPRLDPVLADLEAMIEDAILVGHALDFDLAVLDRERRARGRPPLPNARVDTQRLVAALFPEGDAVDLDSAAARFGIGILGRHTAEGDARAAGGLFLALLDEVRRHGVRTFGDLLRVQAGGLR
jgi:DNA polymerase III epsilon subunit family exonuclease